MMITRSQSPRLTYQDLLRLPDDLLRHELIDGKNYMIMRKYCSQMVISAAWY